MSYSPCVGILGMRQVGKTTLLRKLAATYHTFDEEAFFRRFEREKGALLELAPAPVALDEIQKHPPAFDALKLSIDRKKRMGRFLVSGSVRFASRRQIRESLTGRIVSLEMFPLSLSECHERPASPFLREVLKGNMERVAEGLWRRRWVTPALREHYLLTGGLPGICFRRAAEVRSELFEQHLDTLLRRDIYLVRQVRLAFPQMREILTALAVREGDPVNLSQVARVAGTSMPTVKSTLAALEGLFLIRPYGRARYLADIGLARHLAAGAPPGVRAQMLRLAYHELTQQLYLQWRHQARMGPYTTRGGIDVPFLLQFNDGRRLAVLIDIGERPSDKSLKSVTWLKKRFANLRAVILMNAGQALPIAADTLAVPIDCLF